MKALIKLWLIWLGMILLWENVLHFTAYSELTLSIPVLGFSCATALICTCLISIPKVGKVIALFLPSLMVLVYGVQLIYHDIFGSFLSLAYVSVGGEALATFYTIVLSSIWRCLPQLVLLIAPLIPFYLLLKRGAFCEHRWSFLVASILVAVVIILVLGRFAINHKQRHDIDSWIDQYGVLTSEVMELSQQLIGEDEIVLSVDSTMDLTSGDNSNYSEDDNIDSGNRNILSEIDFAALRDKSDDETVQMISNYVSSNLGTAKNKYTGIFEDYNLIVICAEAYSPYLVDETLTPTLYRLSNEGIVFKNFYNSFQNLTTNGEYSLCMGLMPDASRLSFAASAMNYVPQCLGNVWSARWGTPYAYHNNAGTFYNRINTHSNMGYNFKAIGCGLDMELGNPTSDLEMFEKTVDEYIDQENFHAYYMTYSGHAEYSFDLNQISKQNQNLINSMDGSEQFLAYYACQLELERAMTYLVERLEEKGIADKTVIVLTGDHMPYGLPQEDYERLAGKATDEPFWQYRNSFICWTGSMKEPVIVDDYCCTQDILPTILNLFGLSYDSRLMTGRDVLADCMHAAVLKDGSFLTEKFIYDSRSAKTTWTPGQTPDEAYAQSVIDAIQNQFYLSAAILESDYYRIAYSTLGHINGDAPTQIESIYTDIEGTWYKDSVEELTRQGVLLGGGVGEFNGDRSATRAEVLTILIRSMQLPVDNVELPYTDLKTGGWYVDAVSAAWKAGLLPDGETEFRPDEIMTEEETVELLKKAAAFLNIKKADKWAEDTVAAAVRKQNKVGWTGNGICRGAVAYLTAALLQAQR